MFQFGPRTTQDLQIAHIAAQVLGPATLYWTSLIGATAALHVSVGLGLAASMLSYLLYGKYNGMPTTK